MNHPPCTTLSEVETCAVALAACPDADGRIIGLAIQVAIAAIRSNHSGVFVQMLTHFDAYYSLCEGHDYQPSNGGH